MRKQECIDEMFSIYGMESTMFLVTIIYTDKIDRNAEEYTEFSEWDVFEREVISNFFSNKCSIRKVDNFSTLVLIPEIWDIGMCGDCAVCLVESVEYQVSRKGGSCKCYVELQKPSLHLRTD